MLIEQELELGEWVSVSDRREEKDDEKRDVMLSSSSSESVSQSELTNSLERGPLRDVRSLEPLSRCLRRGIDKSSLETAERLLLLPLCGRWYISRESTSRLSLFIRQ